MDNIKPCISKNDLKFQTYKYIMLIKYFIVCTCKLFTQVQLVINISITFFTKFPDFLKCINILEDQPLYNFHFLWILVEGPQIYKQGWYTFVQPLS